MLIYPTLCSPGSVREPGSLQQVALEKPAGATQLAFWLGAFKAYQQLLRGKES